MKSQKRISMTLLCGLILACLLCLSAPMAFAAPAAEVTLTVNQVFTKPASPSPGSQAAAPLEEIFQYQLVPLAASNPMPTGTAAGIYSFAIAGNVDTEIGPIVFSEPGKYNYKLLHTTQAKPGYVYDQTIYTLEILVKASGSYSVVAARDGGDKQEALRYTHSYQALASDPLVMVDPPVVKTVIGIPLRAETFTFKLEAGDPNNPMPAGSANGVKTLQIVGSGSGEFGVWAYTQPGVYFYTITEVNTGARGYDYDSTVYTITDTVSAVDGELEVSRVVTNGANRQVTSLSYVNIYTGAGLPSFLIIPIVPIIPVVVPGLPSVPGGQAPGNSPTNPVGPSNPSNPGSAVNSVNPGNPPRGPKTGDESQIPLLAVLFCAGFAAALGSAGYLFAGRRRGRKGSV
ncbi:MAG: sortase B protein-sorting domain-containing protein [Oscillospiraceae bacterium]|nr:sortase B protein-sorting domain-containing protein [Oscillospiraceae bacterium]